MVKKIIKDNAGYSLIEMIIVLAIVAVVTGMAGATVTMIHSAKAKSAATTLDSAVAELATKSKNVQAEFDSDGDGVLEKCNFCIKIYKDTDGVYYIQKGYYYPNVAPTGDRYIFDNTDPSNGGKGVSLSAYVDIDYTPVGGTAYDLDSQIIRYTKNGDCAEGYGTFTFYKRNGTMVAESFIRQNGSHETK